MSTCFLNTSRDGDSTISLGSLFQCFITLSVKKFFLISSLNLLWCNLRPFPLVLLLVTGEKRLTATSPTSFQVAVDSEKVSPQPPLLQAKQAQFPRLLLLRLVLQTPHQPRCPSLDTLQHLNVLLVVRGPKTEHSWTEGMGLGTRLMLEIALFSSAPFSMIGKAHFEGKSTFCNTSRKENCSTCCKPLAVLSFRELPHQQLLLSWAASTSRLLRAQRWAQVRHHCIPPETCTWWDEDSEAEGVACTVGTTCTQHWHNLNC